MGIASSPKLQTSNLLFSLSPSLSSSMDTFSSSVSTFKVPSLPTSHREFHHFRTTPYASKAQGHVSSTSKPAFIPKTKSIFSHKNPPSLLFSEAPSPPPNPIFHRKPATGYAAALVDVAQTTDSLHLVQRDVQRLLGILKSTSYEEESALEEKGRFHRHVEALMKMLVKRNKSGIVREVLEEFERIYDELCGTQVVWVSSERKMAEDQLFGIAENVQKLSGAVKVKVRNLVHESLPPFAV